MYKYSCRDCRIRERCIEQGDIPNHIKAMIRTAFGARTDTLPMWGILQKNCLLIQYDEERERKTVEESILSRRLREVRAAKEQADEESAAEVDQAAGQSEPVAPLASSSAEPTTARVFDPGEDRLVSFPTSPDLEAPARQVFPPEIDKVPRTHPLESAPLAQELSSVATRLCWLILDDSQRRILLPVTGKLIIGRFDPELTEPLDVDLTCEDQAELSVSRRHAQIEGVESHHTIEDLGSANGVFVNGVQLTPGRNFPLLPGNQIMLGRLHLHYETVPTDFLSMLPGRAAEIRHFLLVTHTGRKIEIAPPDNIIIGRADPEADYVPGIDLAQDGEVAFRVSRRHARIIWSNQLPYLKDLTSTFGTRFNGDKLHPGRSVLLRPGDHVSLGGCVLAYDILL